MAAYKGPKLSSLRGDALKARLAHLSATHNTAAIPLKYLTTSQARERVMNARLDSPVVPGDSMTNRDLAREANAATSVQYGPLMASQALQPKQTNDYYNQYLSTLKAAQDSQAAQGQALATTLGNIGQAGQDAATAENTRVNDQAVADAKVRGATQDPSLAANAANAAQVTRNIATGGAQTAGLLGQNAAAYMTALEASGGAARLGALNRNTSDALQTKREAGAFKSQYVGKRRSEEVTNTATAALAGQKQDTADASFSAQTGYTPAQWAQMTPAERLTALKKATKAKTKPAAPPKPRSQEEVDRPYLTKYGLTYKQFKAKVAAGQKPKPLSSKPGGKGKTPKPVTGPGSLPPAKEASYVSQVEKIYSWLTSPPKWPSGPKKGRQMTPAEVVNSLSHAGALSPKGPIDPRILDIARSRYHNKGKIGQFGVKRAHELGLHVGGRWGQA